MSELDEIVAALDSSDAEERRRATARLGRLESTATVEPLVKALGDQDWRVRKEAVQAAQVLGPLPRLLRELVRLFRPGDNVGLRNAAVEALSSLGPNAIDVIAAEVPSLDADGRKLAVDTLARTGDASALMVLRILVSDADANVRAAAVEAVAAVGAAAHEDAAQLLERCLSSDDEFVRLAALAGLNQLEVVVPWPRLEALVDHPVLARPALAAAGRSGDPAAAAVLAQGLEDFRGSLWRSALEALADYARLGPATLEGARAALRALPQVAIDRLLTHARAHDSPTVTRAALVVAGALGTREAAGVAVSALVDDRSAAEAEEALVMMGPSAVESVVARIGIGSAEERAACLDLIARLMDDSNRASAVAAMNSSLSHPSLEVVRSALSAISQVGDESSLAPVAELLTRDPPTAIRMTAETALAECARRHPERARAMVRACKPGTPDVYAAAVIVGALDPPVLGSSAEDVQFLSDALSEASAAIRRAAVDSLAAISSDEAVDAVAFALTDEERDVQLAAVRALGRLRSDHGAAGVDRLLDVVRSSEDEALVAAAIRALGDTGDPRALSVLRPIARSGPPLSAVCAVEAIATVDEPRRVDALLDALAHPDSEVVKAALRSLGEERDPRVVTRVGACCDHEAWDVRRLAADLLGAMGGPVATGLLRSKLSSETEPLVREAIQRGLAELETEGGKRRTVPPPGLGSWRP